MRFYNPLFMLTLIFLSWSDLLLENFNDGNHYGINKGYWSYYTDAIDDGASILITSNKNGHITPDAKSHNESKALFFSYTLDKGNYTWEPYVEMEFTLNGDRSFDATPYQALSYWYKGEAHTFSVKGHSVRDWAFHERSIPSSEKWRKIIIAIPGGVHQPNWGKSREFSQDHLFALAWRITGETDQKGALALDDITFESTYTYVKKYDLKVRDAEIPKIQALPKGAVITNPLQAKAEKYLNKGVSLHNWLEENAPFEDFRYSKSDIERFAQQGFEGIRIPIDIDLYVLDKAKVIAGEVPLEMDPLIWTPLDSLVNWTAELELSLTIDYHQYDASLNARSIYDASYRTMAAQAWQTVAKRYSTNPREDIFYELTNEPGISEDVARDGWHDLTIEMIDSIRSVDTIHTLIWGDTRWYEIENLIKNKPFKEQNMIYSFHYYEPFLFTHQGASWTGMGSTRNTPFPYSKERWHTEYEYFGVQEGTEDWVKDQYQDYYKMGNRNAMMNQILVAKKWAVKHNVALINNEFGAHPLAAESQDLVAYFQTVCSIFEELHIPWQVWFGPFDDEGELLCEGMGKALAIQ